MPNYLKYCVSTAFIFGIGLCVYFIGTGNLSDRETVFVSIVLTILSILATWIFSHIYSQSQYKKAIDEVQESHRANLRTYALKAAEKVNNLSIQLTRLSSYLEESLEESNDDRIREGLLSKQERIQSAIYMINMLKSINDTALSDWEGVIGDELDEQRELKAEKEAEIENLIERLESISESQMTAQQHAEDSTQALAGEIEYLKRDLRSMAVNIGLTPIRLAKSSDKKPPRQTVEVNCPMCGSNITYKQRTNPKSIKSLKCQTCESKLFSIYNPEKGFIIEKRHFTTEKVNCPVCSTLLSIEIDNYPHSFITVQCANCQSQINIKRTTEGIEITTKQINTKQINIENTVLTDDIIQMVRDNLPEQPWPTGIHKIIADKLGLPHSVVSNAISNLIRTGVFNVQFYGTVYVPKSDSVNKKAQDN